MPESAEVWFVDISVQRKFIPESSLSNQNYYENIMESNQNNTKKLWKVAKNIKKRSWPSYNRFKKNRERIQFKIYKHREKLAQEIEIDKNVTFEKIKNELNETDYQDMRNIISGVKNIKSPRFEGLKSEMVKTISSCLIEHLVYIINRCITLGYWPSTFKESIVISIFKKGDRAGNFSYNKLDENI